MRYILLIFMLFINFGCDYAPTEHTHEHDHEHTHDYTYEHTHDGIVHEHEFIEHDHEHEHEDNGGACLKYSESGGEFTCYENWTESYCLSREKQWTTLTCEEFCDDVNSGDWLDWDGYGDDQGFTIKDCVINSDFPD